VHGQIDGPEYILKKKKIDLKINLHTNLIWHNKKEHYVCIGFKACDKDEWGCFRVFMKMVEEEKETWNMHNVSRGDFSKDDELSLYDGFVITGI
jgi:hypothetical protein